MKRDVTMLLLVFLLGNHFTYARTLKEIEKTKTLIIGCKVDPDRSRQKLQNRTLNYANGYDLELINLMVKAFREKSIENFEYEVLDPNERIEALENDEVDIIIACFSVTEDRKKQIDFSIPYVFNPGLALITNNIERYPVIYDILNEKTKISVIKGTTSQKALYLFQEIEGKKEFHIEEFNSYDDAMLALKKRNIDAHLDDFNKLLYADFSEPDLNIVGFLPVQYTETRDAYAIGMKKGCKRLVKEINEILTENLAHLNQ